MLSRNKEGYYMLTIGITTFKRRFELVESLIKKIKTFEPNIEIILTINAD